MMKEDALSAEDESWFRAQVEEALGDPRPGIPQDVAMDQTRKIIDRIAARKSGESEKWGVDQIL